MIPSILTGLSVLILRGVLTLQNHWKMVGSNDGGPKNIGGEIAVRPDPEVVRERAGTSQCFTRRVILDPVKQCHLMVCSGVLPFGKIPGLFR